jgi:hypothetical protein
MTEPLVIDGWTCSEKHGVRQAQRGRVTIESDEDGITLDDSTRYYPSGSYGLPASVLSWLTDKGKSDGAARLAHLEESARLLRELFRFGLRPTMVHEGMLAEGESLNAWLEADKAVRE